MRAVRLLLAAGEIIHEAGIAVKTVDTTGAGDIFRGAFIYALLRGDAPGEILRFANAAAALSCTKLGAINSVPTLEEIETRDDKPQRHRATDKT